jgi:hypothetical protein
VKKKKSGNLQIYKLPNHSWLPGDWVEPGTKHDTPEIVVRRMGGRVLVRDSTWEQTKQPRYNYSKIFCGENNPNDTWDSQKLWIAGTTIIGILTQRARDGDADAALELARLAGEATEHLTNICKARPGLFLPLSRLRRAWPVIKKRNAKLEHFHK